MRVAQGGDVQITDVPQSQYDGVCLYQSLVLCVSTIILSGMKIFIAKRFDLKDKISFFLHNGIES